MTLSSSAAWLLGRMLCLCAAGFLASASIAKGQERFKSPDDAVAALVSAVRASNFSQMHAILGVQGREIISSGDRVADAADRQRFLSAYDAKHSITEQGDAATLIVGSDDFPFPIPMARVDGRWMFDAEVGRKEILFRRLGRNELSAIQACLAYFDAQYEYAAKDRTGQGAGVYAQRIVSQPGAKDGLYWATEQGEEPSPLGGLAAEAAAEGYEAGRARRPFHGYYYKILKRQGPAALGGAADYVVGGRMIGGFALLAYPAEYSRSGIMSFIVNHAGTVYQKDLGFGTSRIAARMRTFNPDSTWEKVSPAKD